ncbi:MAG: glycosyltransferase [Lachnospiraceae bacterium]|nr:glycosyltransferase [Lachnospiraceae bacterium]
MKIYAINQKSYGIEHVAAALRSMGHEVTLDSFVFDDTRISPEFDNYFEKKIADKGYDAVFTFNFFPVISANCKKYNIKYISWIYDNPHINLYSYTIINPCNYIFIFDKETYLELKNGGITTVYYLPLAAGVDAFDKFTVTPEIMQKYQSDVSFVGSLYNEKHCLYSHFNSLPPYTKGYLDGLIQAQSKIYGYFFLKELLTPELVAEMQKVVPYPPNKEGIETAEYVYAHCFMARKVTEIERHDLIKKISEKYNMKLYTSGDTSVFPHVNSMGPVDYYNTMPYVFKCSKINLNITLKSILSGMPLRALDIMGCGGFLLTNFQSEFMDYFTPGEDLAIYESESHLLEQIEYYLNHDDERMAIAKNGYKKVKQFHTFKNRLSEICDIANL